MSLTVNTTRKQREQEERSMAVILQQRTYRTADGRACHRGDPEAAFLVGPEGARVTDATARSLGLVNGRIPDKGEQPPQARGDRTGRAEPGQGRPVQQAGPDADGLESVPASELKTIARDAGVPSYGSMNKATLIDEIRRRRATAPPMPAASASTSNEEPDGPDSQGQGAQGAGQGQGAAGAAPAAGGSAGEGDNDPEQGPGKGPGSGLL